MHTDKSIAIRFHKGKFNHKISHLSFYLFTQFKLGIPYDNIFRKSKMKYTIHYDSDTLHLAEANITTTVCRNQIACRQ